MLSLPEQEQPRQKPVPVVRRSLGLLLLFVSIAAGGFVVKGTLFPGGGERADTNHQTQWPRHREDFENPWQRHAVNYDEAVAHLEELARALVRYREHMGDGMRWPYDLDELTMLGLIRADFDFTGLLSGRPLSYQPDLPAGYPPDRWIMVHDVDFGWVSPRHDRRPGRGVRAAAVILADGRVMLLEGDDLQLYGGISAGTESMR